MSHIWPYAIAFLGALVVTLILTPLVRELNRRLGMVDMPDARRINTVPIPRGGGLALFLGVIGTYSVFRLFSSTLPPTDHLYVRAALLATGIVVVGLIDDKFSLPPKVKLAGQVAVAVLTWAWVGLGFRDLWPAIPAWLDCALTVFWIVGAINAFNLIDGLDGLASGLALIATMGMAGVLFFTGRSSAAIFHFALAGGLVGFLRYNYNPASVFLGDSGSMFIGYVLSILPLLSHAQDSYLVSLGVPLLAMGVPIFDTSLAILRRLVRRVLEHGKSAADGQVMTADKDHVHHRILRAVGLSQRKAAWILYLCAAFLVLVGLCSTALKSRAGGLWLFALTLASVIIFRDMSRIELFDIGKLLGSVAHDKSAAMRRRRARAAVPLFVAYDVAALTVAYAIVYYSYAGGIGPQLGMKGLLVNATCVFACLIFFRAYRTIWARAMLSNYLRLAAACILGSIIAQIIIYYVPSLEELNATPFAIEYAAVTTLFVIFGRAFRPCVRDLFYAMDCSRILANKGSSRIIVYGAGLRYRAFRRELVRSAARNSRVIVGIMDDDILLHGHFIGGIRVMGSLMQAKEIIAATHADTVVIACELKPGWLAVVKQTLAPLGVKVIQFDYSEKDVPLT